MIANLLSLYFFSPISFDLCTIPPWWSHFWNRNRRQRHQNLGFERAHQRGDLPWTFRTDHCPLLLWEWLLPGYCCRWCSGQAVGFAEVEELQEYHLGWAAWGKKQGRKKGFADQCVWSLCQQELALAHTGISVTGIDCSGGHIVQKVIWGRCCKHGSKISLTGIEMTHFSKQILVHEWVHFSELSTICAKVA